MKDYDCGSIPRLQRPAFCIFMQLFIVDLSFEKSSKGEYIIDSLPPPSTIMVEVFL